MLPAGRFSEGVYVTERDVSAWREAGPNPRLRFEIRSPLASRPRGMGGPALRSGRWGGDGFWDPGTYWFPMGRPRARSPALGELLSPSESRSPCSGWGRENSLWAPSVQSGLPALRASA